MLGGRQACRHGAVTVVQANPAQCRACAGIEGWANTQIVQQRQIAGRDAFAANLAARKALFFDQRNGPASTGEPYRHACASGASTDDYGIKIRQYEMH